MQIKRITLSEYQLVTGLFDKYRVFYKQPSDIPLAEKFIRERLENKESVIFVAFDNDGSPAGFTQLYPLISSVRAIKNWLLNDLYVDAAYRKQGVGEALIKTAMDFAAGENAVYLKLETAVDNYAAQSLYEAIGFKKQEPETGYLTYKIEVNKQ
ncbi:GNAT family N-acetyltransferase [Mucilaginibacter gotjawali]|uniref:Mycothiol acetyltransferase n=2 Tax=Mucilaginibacter gotjawali TaxID=1550579 RepID=A0A0X8X568_9SPHI|nr:GNAT family N-acetyltransferase [Mucilaginibacter gotjawali]MBB3059003.1 ribosomal protein S18 acetylase RimI-like enzyme [Mucilaginibacter gotjawali]BAU55816.1 Mycothiol acetyltransferase [Mucilaginibacter gotjawali]